VGSEIPGEEGEDTVLPATGTETDREAAEEVARRMRWGVALTLVGAALLGFGTDLPVQHVLGLPLLLVLLPGLAWAQAPLVSVDDLERIPVYLGSMAAILALGLVALLLALPGPGLAAIGFSLLPPLDFLLWTAGLTVAGSVLVILFTPVGRAGADHHAQFVLELLPRSAREKRLFAGLSLAAGTGEEVAYRGYALAVLQLLPMGPWAAALVSSGGFGLLHAYQGRGGVVRTGLVGLVFAAGVIGSGSLLPAMAAHTLVDLLAGLVVGPGLVRRSRAHPLVSPGAEG
jgi:uncharacterized protein